MAEQEKQDQAGKTAEEPKKKSRKWVFVVAGVLVVAAAGTGGYVMMRGGDPAGAEGEPATAEPEDPAGIVGLDTFLVNLDDAEQDRYMKLTLRLAVTPVSAAEEVSGDDLKMARVRDRILTILSAKTHAEMTTPLGKEGLRREIQARLGPLFEGGRVQDVLFSEFVVQ